MTIKKDLTALKKDIAAISKKLDNLLKTVEKSKTKASMVKAIKARPAKKKVSKITASDQVLKNINRSRKGVDTASLMKKTGFNEKKVRNIVFKLLKLGKIQRAERGLYVGVK